jgi:hypothetical protein
MNPKSTPRVLIAAIAFAMLAACANQKSALEADYGNSVRQVTAASSANPAAHSRPSPATVEGGDADTLSKSVDRMRKAGDQGDDVKKDIVINVGGQGR